MTCTAVVSGETAITARGRLREAAERVLDRLWIDEVPVRPASEDASLWPSAAAAGREGRPLCRPGRPGPGRAALDRAERLRERARADGGVHLLPTGNVVRDVPVPYRHHRLGMPRLARARAAGRPVVRLHLRNRWAGLARLLGSAKGDSALGGE